MLGIGEAIFGSVVVISFFGFLWAVVVIIARAYKGTARPMDPPPPRRPGDTWTIKLPRDKSQ